MLVLDSQLKGKVVSKCLNAREGNEIVKRNEKMVSSLPLLSFESSVSVKENRDKKRNGFSMHTPFKNL